MKLFSISFVERKIDMDISKFMSLCPVNSQNRKFRMEYKNWRSETDIRYVEFIHVWIGNTEFHKEEQWLLKAIDLDRNVERDFAIKDVIRIVNF